jgi:autotransporter translocation and assembly factor TamB
LTSVSAKPRRLRRWLLGALVALAAGIALISVGLGLVLGTHDGRQWLLARALAALQGAIPGQVRVLSLERLDPLGLELRGISVLDPTGAEVLKLERLAIELAPEQLVSKRIVLRSLVLEHGSVDLTQVARSDRGLVAAFVDPSAPASPPSDEPPPYVRIDVLELRGLELRAPVLEPIGAVTVRGLALDAHFELDGSPRAKLDRLTAELVRDGAPLGRIERVTLWLRHGAPSELSLRATLGAIALGVDARGALPPAERWQDEPATATLFVRGVSGRELAALLRQPELALTFDGDASLALEAAGPPRELGVKATLTSAAGPLQLVGAIHDFARAELELALDGFEPAKLRAELPSATVGLRLSATADATDPARVPFSLALSQARVGKEPLPELTLSARYEQSALHDIDLLLREGDSAFSARGQATFAGAAELTLALDLRDQALARLGRVGGMPARGHVTLDAKVTRAESGQLGLMGKLGGRALSTRGAALERLDASFAFSGTPPALSGELTLAARNLSAGTERVPNLALTLQGGPQRWLAKADGDLGVATAALDLLLEPGPDELVLWGNARGKLQGTPFELDISRTRLTPGALSTEGVELELAGQRLRLWGELSERSAELELESEPIELAALGRLAALPEPLAGSAHLTGRMQGSLAEPRASLRLELRGVTLGERPALDLQAQAALDAAAGSAGLDLTLQSSAPRRSPAGDIAPAVSSTPALSTTPTMNAATTPAGEQLALELDAATRFAVGAPWTDEIGVGTGDVTLTLAHLDLAFVEAGLGAESLGTSGSVSAQAHARGTLADPQLDARLRAELEPHGTKSKLELTHTLAYAKGRVDATLAVDDARGRWIDLKTALGFAEGARALTLEQLLADVNAALRSARVQLDARVARRELGELPLRDAERLPPAALEATLHATRAPDAEPVAELALTLRQTRAVEALAGCRGSGTSAELRARLRDGALSAELVGASRERKLFEASLDTSARLAPVLAGEAVTPGRLDAKVSAERVDLGTLPLLCGRVAGMLSTNVRLDDALGDSPRLDLQLTTDQLRLGGVRGIDLRASARANKSASELDASLTTPEGKSTLAARVPITWSRGKFVLADDAPVSLQAALARLPIAPFLDPRGAVSYASGSVSGDIAVSGTLKQPRLAGKVELENVAFTATNLAQPLHDVRGRIAFTEHSIEIENFEARDKDGTLRLDGVIDLASLDSIDARLHIVAKRFPLRQEGQVVAISDVDAQVRTSVAKDRTEAVVRLSEVDTWIENASVQKGLSLEAHPDFVVDGTKPKPPKVATGSDAPPTAATPALAKQAPEPEPTEHVTALTLDASDRFWVKRDDFAVKLATKLDVRIQGDEVRITGTVDIDRGYLQLLGKIFALERGSKLEFTGSGAPDPLVTISATHENRRSGQQIKVQIGGRGSKPELTFFVDDDEVTAGNAFLAIYGSQQSNEKPSEAGDQARQFVGGLAAGLLATSARRELGAAAPIIMVEPGAQTGQGRLRAGLELDSLVPAFLQDLITGVYFEGIVARESEDPEANEASVQGGALLELYFPKGFFSTGQYGPGSTWSLDWGWQL